MGGGSCWGERRTQRVHDVAPPPAPGGAAQQPQIGNYVAGGAVAGDALPHDDSLVQALQAQAQTNPHLPHLLELAELRQRQLSLDGYSVSPPDSERVSTHPTPPATSPAALPPPMSAPTHARTPDALSRMFGSGDVLPASPVLPPLPKCGPNHLDGAGLFFESAFETVDSNDTGTLSPFDSTSFNARKAAEFAAEMSAYIKTLAPAGVPEGISNSSPFSNLNLLRAAQPMHLGEGHNPTGLAAGEVIAQGQYRQGLVMGPSDALPGAVPSASSTASLATEWGGYAVARPMHATSSNQPAPLSPPSFPNSMSAQSLATNRSVSR